MYEKKSIKTRQFNSKTAVICKINVMKLWIFYLIYLPIEVQLLMDIIQLAKLHLKSSCNKPYNFVTGEIYLKYGS